MSTVSRRDFLCSAAVAGVAAATVPSVFAQATDKAKVTLAFVGVGHIHTPGFIDLVKTRADVRVKSVWDHDLERADKRAKQLGAAVVKEAAAIWSDPEINAVIICSETNRHLDLVLAGAAAGKHMFIEKPLGITGAESFQMAKAIEAKKLLFTTGYFMRTDAKHIFLKEEIAKGNFGKITRVRGSNCHSGSLGGWFDTEWRWMADPKISGVGAFGDLGTHKLDILMWMLGPIEEATAELRSVTGRYGNCDETGEGLMRFSNGVIGTLAAGWVDIEDPVQLLISGTEGHAVVHDNHLYYRSKKVADSDSKEPFTKFPPPPRAPLHQFLDAVGGDPTMPLVKPMEAAARVAVMEAMYTGARERRWVKVQGA
jgi:predicted dehydrogenase